MTMFWAIVLQIVLIFLNAVFAAAEIAVISFNENKLKKLADDGNKKAKRLISLTSHPTKFLSTIQVAITLAGLLGSAFAADFFAEPLAQAIINAAGIESSAGITAINTVCVIFITIVLAFFNITFGELVPKRVAMKWAEKYSLGISGVLKVVSVVFTPLVWLLTVSSNAVLRIFGIKKDEDDNTVTEEDIVLMAEAGSEKGQIDEKESELIQNVFDFKDNTAGEVCTHRKDVDIVFTGENDSKWEKTVYGSRHIYYPVCGKDADDVLGILNTKIYFRLKDKSRKNVMEKAVQQAVFVPENMPANELFYRMKDTKEHVMIVLDEYGGMSGIVTINDLLELLVGDMADKDEKSEYSIEKIADDKWHIIGLAPMEKVEEALDMDLPDEEKEDCETFSGYVCSVMSSVPDDGDTPEIDSDGLHIEVKKVSSHRIVEMIVTKQSAKEEQTAVDEDKNKEKED